MTKLLKQLSSWVAKQKAVGKLSSYAAKFPHPLRAGVRGRGMTAAFTLAEVLITITIIGVVAALTIPTLIANTNEKGLNTADSAFQRRLGEALKIMNIQGTLADHESTQEFVDELSRHMKIIKTCPSDKLSECFVSEFKAEDKTIKVEDLTKSKNLNKKNDYGTETIGVVFGNGIRALVAYNPNCNQNQFDNSNEDNSPVKLTSTVSGKNKTVTLETDSLAILYNLQERKNKNIYSATDNIRGLNIAITKCNGTEISHNGTKYCYLALNYSSINTCDGTNEWDKDYTSNVSGVYCKVNYWAGAKKACADLQMKLPSRDPLITLFKNDNWTDKPTSGHFWSATDDGGGRAYYVDSSGNAGSDDKGEINNNVVLCVAN